MLRFIAIPYLCLHINHFAVEMREKLTQAARGFMTFYIVDSQRVHKLPIPSIVPFD